MQYRLVVLVLALAALALVVRWWQTPSGQCEVAEETQAGFWEAPSHFCERAGLASMQIILGPERKGKANGRVAFINAAKTDGTVIEDGFAVIRGKGRALVKKRGPRGSEWVVKSVGITGSRILPSELTMAIAPARGHMQLESRGKVYADLFRNSEASLGVELGDTGGSGDGTKL